MAFDAAWSGGVRIGVEAAPGADFWAPVRARLPRDGATTIMGRAGRALERLARSGGVERVERRARQE
jgi:hypothetical protein